MRWYELCIYIVALLLVSCGTIKHKVTSVRDTVYVVQECSLALQQDYTWLINDTTTTIMGDTIATIIKSTSINAKGRLSMERKESQNEIKASTTESQSKKSAEANFDVLKFAAAVLLIAILILFLLKIATS